MAGLQPKGQATLTRVLFAVYLLALSWLILFKLQFSVPVMEDGRVINLIPLLGSFDAGGAIGIGEIRNNILVFIPLGLYICMLKYNLPFLKKVLAIVVSTLVFEAAQYIFAIGRADITDVLSNALGGIIGIGLYALFCKLMKGRTNKVLLMLAAAVTIFAVLLVAVLLLNRRWIRIQ